MKKIALTLAAIAALSTAGFAASKRTADLRDLQPDSFASTSNVTTEAAPFAVEEGVLSSYDRMIENVTEHNQGDY